MRSCAKLSMCITKCATTSLFKVEMLKTLRSLNQELKVSYNIYRTLCLTARRYVVRGDVNKYTIRTHSCGQLTADDVGKQVNLYGWIQYTRFDNKIIALRDSYGVIQCIVNRKELRNSLKTLKFTNESVISVSGIVQDRPKGQANERLSTGQVEVLVDNIELLSNADKDLPILTRNDQTNLSISNQLKYRYLFLRNNDMQRALRFRSDLCQAFRRQLLDIGFVECETPTLFNRTPGGANEFIVPTQTPGKFYSLVQSPQQLKQLLMIGGLDRYFQICKCYRDESGRSDRQPEFTQLDIELSFTSQELIMNLVEDITRNALQEVLPSDRLVPVEEAFDRISYQDAMVRYGTDKPDMRFDWPIEHDQSTLFMNVPFKLSHDELIRIFADLNVDEAGSQIKITCDSGKTCIRMRDKSENSQEILGVLRQHIARYLNDRGEKVYKERFKFIWVIDFPLFTQNDEGNIEPNHHPFTAPTEATVHMLPKDPKRVIGQHYDLVLNGQEVGGGSVRIHEAGLQRQIFEDVLGVDEKAFSYFIDALKSGCPPHGGIALGLDRLLAIILGKDSIRDVIAFPKSTNGRDLLTDCPQEIDASVKKLYHLMDNNKA